jgi:hypothetical protein
MRKYFVVGTPFGGGFFGEIYVEHVWGEKHVRGESPEVALQDFVDSHADGPGLYSAALWDSADSYHERQEPLARWLSNHEIAKEELTRDLGAYSYFGHGPGDFEIDGVRHRIPDPKGGRLVPIHTQEPKQ